MLRILFLLSSIGFLSSLTVHFGLLFWPDIAATKHIRFLHIGIFITFTPFIFYLANGKSKNNFMTEFTNIIPIKYSVLCALLFFYIFVNFVIFMAKSKGGVADIWQEQYVLHNHGKLIRYITEAEYKVLQVNEIRGFSGHWLFFYFTPMVFFYFKIKSK
ncbi:hypothetical protein [Cellvibrio sp. pealriver]|uniref:hypothetical protein n=1 Tax=Cellvibrio sp. pealriver TaxID=1622269 RepID=UPI00066FCD28|nr:hypothetical protein [Cellvibrio sp. pealriver]